MRGWALRARGAVAEWFPVAVVALVALAAVGGWVTYDAHLDRGTTTEQRTVGEWRVDGSFQHRAAVVDAGGTALANTSVVENRSVYLQTVMPVLEGAFVFDHRDGTAPLTVSVDSRLRVRSVGTESDTVYWERTRPLATERATLSPGERLRVPFGLNVTETVATARETNRQLRAPGELRTRIEVNVSAAPPDGAARELSFALRIDGRTDTYGVTADGGEETFPRTTTVTVPERTGPVRGVGGPLALVVGLAGAAGLAAARARGALAPSAAESEWLTYRAHREEFADWVSTATLPAEARSLPAGEAASLKDLVDLAVSTDGAVLSPPDDDAYHVVVGDRRYTYRPPPAPGAATTDPTATDRHGTAVRPVEPADDDGAAVAGERGAATGESGTATDESGTATGENGGATGENGTAAGESCTAAGENGTATGGDAAGDRATGGNGDGAADGSFVDVVGAEQFEELAAAGIGSPAALADADPAAVADALGVDREEGAALVARAEELVEVADER